MPNSDPNELEKFIHEQLQKLPDREAPDNLLASVMAAIAARENLPWWRQPFTEWPRQIQVLLFSALAGLLVCAVYLAGRPAESVALPHLIEQASSLAWIWRLLYSLGESALLIVRNLPGSFFLVSGTFFALLYAACLAAGAALYRVAARSPSHCA